jgi:esterase/lipase
MAKIIFYNSRKLKLVGNLCSINSKSIIIMAHGFTNDKYSNGRFEKLASAWNSIGHDSLAFDFSGCGESESDFITVSNQVDDFKSALNLCIEKGYNKIALFGNSYGSLICLKSYRSEIATIMLTCPITESMYYNWEDYFNKNDLEKIYNVGYAEIRISPEKTCKISKQTLIDFEKIDQKELLHKIICPVLIIHGDNIIDKEELELLEKSKKGMKYLPVSSRLEILHGEKHGLRNKWDEVVEITKNWLLKYM